MRKGYVKVHENPSGVSFLSFLGKSLDFSTEEGRRSNYEIKVEEEKSRAKENRKFSEEKREE